MERQANIEVMMTKPDRAVRYRHGQELEVAAVLKNHYLDGIYTAGEVVRIFDSIAERCKALVRSGKYRL